MTEQTTTVFQMPDDLLYRHIRRRNMTLLLEPVTTPSGISMECEGRP
ncbi:MAG: hypothetical protein ACR2O4_04130 [Hyphomicrobiaceae bacterium]